MQRNYLYIFVFFLAAIHSVKAQIDPKVQAAAKAQLAQKGISEEEMRKRLLDKGIDINNVTTNQLPQLQYTIEDIIREIDTDKLSKQLKNQIDTIAPKKSTEQFTNQALNTSLTPTSTQVEAFNIQEEVKDKIKDGASVEEAVAESIAETAKEQLPEAKIWGQQIFRNKSLDAYRSVKDVKPPDSYILGAGDEITISIFGNSQADLRYTIDEDGFITPDRMQKIALKGVPYGKAKELVRSRFSQFYVFRADQFIMSLTTARTVNISIFGEAIQNGSYTLSAVNSVFNAIAQAGGPSNIGSVRNIQLYRNGKPQKIDIYQFLNNPALQFDIRIENNDIVHIPVVQKVVTISGAINRPMSYEMLPEENLKHLIGYSASFTANAYPQKLQVKRLIDFKPVYIDVDFTIQPDFALQHGDEITVPIAADIVENYATVEGEIDFPGKYALNTTPTIADLVLKMGLRRSSKTDLAFLYRTRSDNKLQFIQLNLDSVRANPNAANFNIPLRPLDKVVVYKNERFTDKGFIKLNGAVRVKNDSIEYTDGLLLDDVLKLAGGLQETAADFGYIIRSDIQNRDIKAYIRIHPKAALQKKTNPENIALQVGDVIKIFSTKEFSDKATVSVSGAVRNPGVLPYGDKLSLNDALLISGGMRLEADASRVEVFRVEFDNDKPSRTLAVQYEVGKSLNAEGDDIYLQPYDEVIVRNIKDFSLIKKVTLDGEAMYPGEYPLLDKNERISSLIKRAGGLAPEAFPEGATLYRMMDNTGYVIIRLDKVAVEKKYDFFLKEGDIITIPKSKDLVTILTNHTNVQEVNNNRYLTEGKMSVAYEAGKRASWYIREYAGGRSNTGSRRKIIVEYPNGHLKRSRNFLFFTRTPQVKIGSRIYIGAKRVKEKKEKKEGKSIDWDKRFTQILATASTLATIILAANAIK